MSNGDEFKEALRTVSEFRRHTAETECGDIDVLAAERHVQEMLRRVGREIMVAVFGRANDMAPEVLINGARWGNRRTIKASLWRRPDRDPVRGGGEIQPAGRVGRMNSP